VLDPSSEARETFEQEVSSWGLRVEQVRSPQEAVSEADVVVTCAPIVKSPKPAYIQTTVLFITSDF
jgi:ornithine cyclodeaminase/alanine dehydrogenase-like protein (mu-crystallin family)